MTNGIYGVTNGQMRENFWLIKNRFTANRELADEVS